MTRSWLAFGRVCWDIDFLQVYGMLSLIVAILVFGLGNKKPGEKSAYSVFNKGMGSLAGTFGAGDFERHLRSQEKVQKDFTEALSSDDDDGDEVGTLKTIGKRKKARRKAALGGRAVTWARARLAALACTDCVASVWCRCSDSASAASFLRPPTHAR